MKISSGILLYRKRNNELEVLLVHMGGPFWAKKDLGSWTIPRGEWKEDNEDQLGAAKREFEEELGSAVPEGKYLDLGEVKQSGHKVVHGFAIKGDWQDPLMSNTFSMEWPPKSGRQQEFPEIDKAEWFALNIAKQKINPAQAEFLDRLSVLIK